MRALFAWMAGALVALLVACGGDTTSSQPQPSATPSTRADIIIKPDEAMTLGISVALSGTQVNLGADIADAAELAVAEFGSVIKGRLIRVQRMDDECTNAEKAVSVAKELLADHTLVGVIGPMCTTGAQAASDDYERALIVHMSPSATRTDLSSRGERFFFRTAWRDDAQAELQAAHATSALVAKTAILIDDGDPYGRGLADAFAAEFEERGGSILARERIQRGTIDFGPLARQVVAANPDIVVFEGLNPEGALLVKALRDGGYTRAFMAPDALLSVRDFIETTGAQGEGAIVTGGPVPDESFVLRFIAKFNRPPSTPFVLQAHDAVTMLLRAIDAAAREEAGNVVIDREAVMQTLRAMTYDGLTGRIAFDERGDRSGETAREVGLRIYQVRAARFEPIE